jgi:hypothetical protein
MPCNSGNPDYANSVYGGIDQQTAAPGQGNLIQMNNPNGGLTGGNAVAPIHGGDEFQAVKLGGRRGRKGKKGSRRGGLGLGGILVPGALVLGSNYTYRKLRGNKKGKSAKRGRGFRPFSRFLSGGSHTANVGSSPEVTGYAGSSTLSPAPIKGGNSLSELQKMDLTKIGGNAGAPELLKIGGNVELPKMGGNAMVPTIGGNEAMETPKMGGTTFVDIAVPAGLVYANDRYYNRKARGKTNRRRSKRNARRSRRNRRA